MLTCVFIFAFISFITHYFFIHSTHIYSLFRILSSYYSCTLIFDLILYSILISIYSLLVHNIHLFLLLILYFSLLHCPFIIFVSLYLIALALHFQFLFSLFSYFNFLDLFGHFILFFIFLLLMSTSALSRPGV